MASWSSVDKRKSTWGDDSDFLLGIELVLVELDDGLEPVLDVDSLRDELVVVTSSFWIERLSGGQLKKHSGQSKRYLPLGLSLLDEAVLNADGSRLGRKKTTDEAMHMCQTLCKIQ